MNYYVLLIAFLIMGIAYSSIDIIIKLIAAIVLRENSGIKRYHILILAFFIGLYEYLLITQT